MTGNLPGRFRRQGATWGAHVSLPPELGCINDDIIHDPGKGGASAPPPRREKLNEPLGAEAAPLQGLKPPNLA
jgi:hypothetical protein